MTDYPATTASGSCIFCEIAQHKQAPMGNGLIYEDDAYMAWLSPFPNTKGFTVVIPKQHFSSDVMALPDEELARFITVTKKVSTLLQEYFDDVGRVGLIAEGTGIDHAHFKLVPMHSTAHFEDGEWKQYHSDQDSFFETYQGYISSHDAAQADLDRLEALASDIRESID